MTFGALSLLGGDLTMASIAVLPVLIGLAVDYAIQFQARFDEAEARGEPEPAGRRGRRRPHDPHRGVATAVGFLVLLLSPVPMVRGFGALLVLGIGLAVLCALCAGFAALVRFPRPAPPCRRLRTPARGRAEAPPALGARARVARRPRLAHAGPGDLASTAGARRGPGGGRGGTGAGHPERGGVRRPRAGAADLQALKDVTVLQEETGVAGEIDVTVRADDITDPEVIAWMTRFQDRVLRANGYRAGKRCAQERNPPELCPALSLPDLFQRRRRAAGARELLDTVPPYFSQGVVTADRDTANLAFGIRLMPLDRQKEVVDDIKAARPARRGGGERGRPPVLAAEANGRPVVALAARALRWWPRFRGVLRAVRRPPLGARGGGAADPDRAGHGLVGRVLFLLGLLPGPLEVELNPMSVTLGALVIAISTEFSVLLVLALPPGARGGAGPARAIELTYASTGAAVLASGATAIAGFAA